MNTCCLRYACVFPSGFPFTWSF